MKKLDKRFLLAAFSLVLLLAEWGSHGVIYTSAKSTEGLSISSSEDGHEDPCKTLIVCSDDKRKDQQIPNFGHNASQHNALFDQASDPRRHTAFGKGQHIPFGAINRLFRPPSPPFHPPEIS